ncbi:MAG: ABC transporter ATP-binding protein [Chitinophagaceae bacterium]|jgi:ABC-type multidrug transport system fused ATPase/permease subunit
MLLKEIIRIVPAQFIPALRLNILFTVFNLTLDFISIILTIPVFIGLFHFETSNPTGFFFNLLSKTKEYQLELIIALVLFYIIKNFISNRTTRFQSHYYYKLSNHLSLSLLHNFFEKPWLEIKAEKKSALTKDIIFIPNNYALYVLSSLVLLISDTILLLLILSCAFFIHPLATLFLLIITLMVIAILYYYDRGKIKTINHSISPKYNQNFNHLMNALNGYVEIKTNQIEHFFLEKFSASNLSLNSIYAELNTARLVKPKYTETFLIVLISCLFLVSRFLLGNNPISLIFISFVFASAIKIIPSINRILTSLTNLKSNLYTIDILKNDAKPLERQTLSPEAIPFNHTIELRNISFQYSSTKPLLHNISLTINKGEIVGIMGDSGNGKSTLVSLITQMMPAGKGHIICDGQIIDKSNRNGFLQHLAYVPQSPFILEGTILENLILNDHNIDQDLIESYLQLFDLQDTINQLPDKLNTFIGSNGYHLSGGQIQRIAIIRALIRNRSFLILDEALNQLDHTLKFKIMESLKDIAQKRGITVLVVSHYKNELEQFCDTIYELSNSALIQIK